MIYLKEIIHARMVKPAGKIRFIKTSKLILKNGLKETGMRTNPTTLRGLSNLRI